MRNILGYDPGGPKANGVACLKFTEEMKKIETDTVGSVDQAMDWFLDKLNGDKPEAIGIDAYMNWETGVSGRRGPDNWLRATYPTQKNSVLYANSAFGAMAIQGMALAIRVRQKWPDSTLNEVHPKVLYFALSKKAYLKPKTKNGPPDQEMVKWLLKETGIKNVRDIHNDHEWDAVLSAWATYQGQEGKYKKNLMDFSKNAICPINGKKPKYYWPDNNKCVSNHGP